MAISTRLQSLRRSSWASSLGSRSSSSRPRNDDAPPRARAADAAASDPATSDSALDRAAAARDACAKARSSAGAAAAVAPRRRDSASIGCSSQTGLGASARTNRGISSAAARRQAGAQPSLWEAIRRYAQQRARGRGWATRTGGLGAPSSPMSSPWSSYAVGRGGVGVGGGVGWGGAVISGN